MTELESQYIIENAVRVRCKSTHKKSTREDITSITYTEKCGRFNIGSSSLSYLNNPESVEIGLYKKFITIEAHLTDCEDFFKVRGREKGIIYSRPLILKILKCTIPYFGNKNTIRLEKIEFCKNKKRDNKPIVIIEI